MKYGQEVRTDLVCCGVSERAGCVCRRGPLAWRMTMLWQSFFVLWMKELVQPTAFWKRAQAASAVEDCNSDFCNTGRLHSRLAYSPSVEMRRAYE